jgi:hypothetical protein
MSEDQPAGTFDLRVRICGLCLFIPEGAAAMHVLMPKAHKHPVCLHVQEPDGTFREAIDLKHRQIKFPRGSPPLDSRLPDIFNMQDYVYQAGSGTPGKVTRKLVVDDELEDPDPAISRLRFYSGSATVLNYGIEWVLKTGDTVVGTHLMPTVVDWLITGLTVPQLEITKLKGEAPLKETVPLSPGREQLVVVIHSPDQYPEEIDEEVCDDPTEKPHFHHYPDLIDCTPLETTLTRAAQGPICPKGMLVTCMLAQAVY